MSTTYEFSAITYPTRGVFRISRSAVRHVDVVQVTLRSGAHIGRGECRPYARYGDSVDSVLAELRAIEHLSPEAALHTLPPGPARNALDCAHLDLQAKLSGRPVWQSLGLAKPKARETAFTISWNDNARMVRDARAAKAHTLLKLKIGPDSLTRVKAVAAARPDAALIIDANEALNESSLPGFLDDLKRLNICLIEQPLPAAATDRLPDTEFTLCADESLHTADDLERLWAQGYRAVNVKLDKCGGLSAGVALMQQAKEMGFTVMAGCMVSSSLAMAPMMVAESLCDFIDLDGPLLLAEDYTPGLRFVGAVIHPPEPELWG